MSTYANAAAHQTGRATRSANLPLHPPLPDTRRVRREPVQQDGTLATSPVPDGNPAALDMIDASASRNESVGGTADPTNGFGNQDPDPGLDASSDLESSFSTSTVVLVPTRRHSFDNLASEKRNYLTLEQEFKLANQNRFSSLPVQKIKGKDHVIEQAKGNMTTKEHELLERRELVIQQGTRPSIEIREPAFQRESTAETRGEGPSQHKGKGADPANWNLAGLNDEERDIEYQWAAYQSLMEQRAYSNTFACDAPPHF
ncbi:hypothetical protein CC2G_015097 [Coprinopsis cinerea AmutBmut pab1-1]|nr:hypothetical protein CC2G_015097 [Coprinopsis cinerea AmutBmut pab1-1]